MLIAESIFLILFYIGKINQSFLWLRLLAVFPFHSNIIASLYFPIIMYKGNYIFLPAENIFIIYFVRRGPLAGESPSAPHSKQWTCSYDLNLQKKFHLFYCSEI